MKVLIFKLCTKWLYELRNIKRKVTTKESFVSSHRTEIGNKTEYVKETLVQKRNVIWCQEKAGRRVALSSYAKITQLPLRNALLKPARV
jgi:hypothetical protein